MPPAENLVASLDQERDGHASFLMSRDCAGEGGTVEDGGVLGEQTALLDVTIRR